MMQRPDSLEKILMLEEIEDKRIRGQQKMRCLNSTINSMDMNEQTLGDSEGQWSLACCSPWGWKESNMT